MIRYWKEAMDVPTPNGENSEHGLGRGVVNSRISLSAHTICNLQNNRNVESRSSQTKNPFFRHSVRIHYHKMAFPSPKVFQANVLASVSDIVEKGLGLKIIITHWAMTIRTYVNLHKQ